MRIVIATLALVMASLPAFGQSERVVALVVSVGDGASRADAVQTQLQLMGAETLRADGPNNAQLRSLVTRFTREAADSRATFVYLDVPSVDFEGRTFVLPKGAALKNPTDLFTQAIPIQAFARSAAQAEQGGAVAMTVVGLPVSLPGTVAATEKAPDTVLDSAAILVAGPDAFPHFLQSLETAATQDKIEIGTLLKQIAAGPGATVSDIPRVPIFLRVPPSTAPAQPAETASTTPQAQSTSAVGLATDQQPPKTTAKETETIEDLTRLEQSVSRAANRSIQRKLRDLGHYKGLVDGIFGPQTRDAIKAFQASRAEEQTGFLDRQQQIDLTP